MRARGQPHRQRDVERQSYAIAQDSVSTARAARIVPKHDPSRRRDLVVVVRDVHAAVARMERLEVDAQREVGAGVQLREAGFDLCGRLSGTSTQALNLLRSAHRGGRGFSRRVLASK